MADIEPRLPFKHRSSFLYERAAVEIRTVFTLLVMDNGVSLLARLCAHQLRLSSAKQAPCLHMGYDSESMDSRHDIGLGWVPARESFLPK